MRKYTIDVPPHILKHKDSDVFLEDRFQGLAIPTGCDWYLAHEVDAALDAKDQCIYKLRARIQQLEGSL